MCFEVFDADSPRRSASSTMIKPSPIATSRSKAHRAGDPRAEERAWKETAGSPVPAASFVLVVSINFRKTNPILWENDQNVPITSPNIPSSSINYLEDFILGSFLSQNFRFKESTFRLEDSKRTEESANFLEAEYYCLSVLLNSCGSPPQDNISSGFSSF